MKLEKQAKLEIEKSNKEFCVRVVEGLKKERQQTVNWHCVKKYFAKDEQPENMTVEQITKRIKKALKNETAHDTKEAIKAIQKIKNDKTEAPEKIDITCKIDWYKNRTWGNCPKGEYSSGYYRKFVGGVTGCGYDKASSWTAKAFNNDNILLKYIINFIEEKHINNLNIRKKLGYGIRIYRGLPYFEGGVGLSSHITILKNLGFNVDYQAGNTWDCLRITQK